MQHVIRFIDTTSSSKQTGFAADLAALASLCFAGYLGLLVF